MENVNTQSCTQPATPVLGTLESIPTSNYTRRWLSVIDKANALRTAFDEVEQNDPRGVRDCRKEIIDPLDIIISTLEDHYLHYSIMCDLDRIANRQTATDHDAE